MNTKEEIINKHASVERKVSDFGQASAYDFKFLTVQNARNAMEEYAKQKAIEFVKYGIKGYTIYPTTDETVNIGGKEWNEEGFDEAAGKLYDQFIESQNK